MMVAGMTRVLLLRTIIIACQLIVSSLLRMALSTLTIKALMSYGILIPRCVSTRITYRINNVYRLNIARLTRVRATSPWQIVLRTASLPVRTRTTPLIVTMSLVDGRIALPRAKNISKVIVTIRPAILSRLALLPRVIHYRSLNCKR